MPSEQPQQGSGRASFGEWQRQSGAWINDVIQQHYVQTGVNLTFAVQYSKRGFSAKRDENKYRRLGLDLFATLVTLSINPPHVKSYLHAADEEYKGFKTPDELRIRIMNALTDKTPSDVLLFKWFNVYEQALINAGLIKVLTEKDNPMQKLWR